jgi:transposase
MYLRTIKRRNADGSEIAYYQLAENIWDPTRRCAVAKVLYSFGRADQVDPDKLKRLARSILRVVDETPQPSAAPSPPIRLRDAWPYGGIFVLEHLWKEVGIDAEIKKLQSGKHIRQPFERALFAMVANRALCPYSKLYCWEQWLREEVYLPSCRELDLHHLYFAMDFLEEHKAQLEKAIYFRMADLMNADVDLIFYDTTSLHFEVDEEDAAELFKQERRYKPLRKRGYSKNGRDDAPQIVIGLAVTREGLPVRWWVFPGHTSDVTTVEQVKADLRGWRLGRCVFVGDGGMISKQNRHLLSLGGGKYILCCRMRQDDEVSQHVLTRAGRYQSVADNLRVKEVIVGEGARAQRYVVCHNPQEQARQQAHRSQLLVELEAELASLDQTRSKGHSKRVCELLTSRRYGRFLRQTPQGLLRIDRAAVAQEARYDGKWIITSNDDTLSAEDLALGYKQLMRVEQAWRQMKSGLRLRPVFHYRPWRICAHVSITVLSLLLERIAEIRAGDTWRNLCAQLESIKVVEYDHDQARIQQTSELRPEVGDLLRRLGVPLPPTLHSVRPLPSSRD